MSERIVTAAEIGDSLGLAGEAGLRTPVVLQNRSGERPAAPPRADSDSNERLAGCCFAGCSAGLLAILLLAWCGAPALAFPPLVVLGYWWLSAPGPPTSARRRRAHATSERPVALEVTGTHLTIDTGHGGRHHYGWSELEAAEIGDGGCLLVLSGQELWLPLTAHAETIFRTAKMLRVCRARAGEQGLAFADEAGDAALSRARMTADDEAAARGLSISGEAEP